MKKTALKGFLCGGALLLACTCLASCDNSSKGNGSTIVDKVTITFKNGDTVLKTEEINKGSCVSEWTPTAGDEEFFGWFAEPTFTHKFDFSAPINENTVVFGSFVGYQKDNRQWAIAGSGASSVLKSSNWGKVFNEAHYMTNESTDKKNIFKLTVNLFSGDQFQFTNPSIDGANVSWGHQRGAGYLQEPTKDGVEYFTIGGSLGGDNSTANITVAKDGKYEFTLFTYPKGDFQKDGTENTYDNRSFYDSITYSYLGDSEEVRAQVETTFYMKGAKITNWGDYVNAYTMMVTKDGKEVLENVYLVTTDQFMFASKNKDVATNEVTDGNVYIKGENLTDAAKDLVDGTANMSVKADGYYTFSYDVETAKLDVVKVDSYTPKPGEYYIDGSFCEWGGAGNATYKLVQDPSDPFLYTLSAPIVLVENDQVGLQYFDKDADAGQGYNGFFGAANTVANENFDLLSNTNVICKVEGTYNVSFNSYSHLLTLTPVPEVAK